jgi:hypothetical protein
MLIPAQGPEPQSPTQSCKYRASIALQLFIETHDTLKQFFAGIHQDALNEFSRPRILALLAEANVVADIPVPVAQDCAQDYMWMEKSLQRKTIWLQSIMRKCQVILLSAQHMAAKITERQFYGNFNTNQEEINY